MISETDKARLHASTMEEAMAYWDRVHSLAKGLDKDNNDSSAYRAAIRDLCLNDLFYLLVVVCKRGDMIHPWVYARVREVEADPDGHLDIWSREHFKSSTITFGLTIQTILKDPDVTVGIFSHTRPIAKAFLRQIMREFEGNKILHTVFPDILWGENTRDAPKWSEDEGIIVKRKSNPKEATIEAWGLVDGQPTSKHYGILLYDDIVVAGSVTTPEMIEKTMTSLEQSYNLGTTPSGKRRFVGTRWHFNDAYSTLEKRGTAKLRWHPGKEGGVEEGKSVYWPEEVHFQKRRDMGPYTYAAQILLNPKADSLMGFKREWLRHYTNIPETGMNNYILVDAASSKKKGSDFTSIWVVRLGRDGNYYCLPVVRDRLSLTERADKIFELHRKYNPKQVRYERYGLMGDIEHIKSRQEQENYRFDITEVGGNLVSKEGRIGRLMPLFEQGRIYLPKSLNVTNYERVVIDNVHAFIEEEYMAFPVGMHDDMCFIAGTKISSPTGNVAIECLKVGDFVSTPKGDRKVTAVSITNENAEVFSLNNGELIGTGNHPVMTKIRGWIPLQELKNDDRLVYQPTRSSSWLSRKKKELLSSRLFLMVTSTIATLRPKVQHTEDTSRRLVGGGCSIDTYGNLLMGRYRTNFMSTIKTAMCSTMTSLTLNVCRLKNISQNIGVKLAQGLNQKNTSSTLNQSDGKQQFGTEHPKGLHGTSKTAKRHGKAEPKKSVFVQFVIKNLKLFSQQGLGFVGMTVTGRISVEVMLQKRRVYNLTVEDAHCYYANGILVHNCDALARICEPDLKLVWPKDGVAVDVVRKVQSHVNSNVAWMR